MTTHLEVRIWRGGADGAFEKFLVPRQASQSVLDVVTWVQHNADAGLSYRFACRVGMCGSCATSGPFCEVHVDKGTRGYGALNIDGCP